MTRGLLPTGDLREPAETTRWRVTARVVPGVCGAEPTRPST